MDKFRLEYETKRRGLTVRDLCAAARISQSTYYKKVKGQSEFTQSEIQAIVDLLGLDSPVGIFFSDKVS